MRSTERQSTHGLHRTRGITLISMYGIISSDILMKKTEFVTKPVGNDIPKLTTRPSRQNVYKSTSSNATGHD